MSIMVLPCYVDAQTSVADTKFDHDRGFYDEPFSVAITTATPGATIRYTLDGSLPSETTGTVYSDPIPVSGTTVLRAMAYSSGLVPSDVDTHTYLFVEDVLQQSYSISGWPNNSYSLGSGGSAIHDYEMDPAIVGDPAYTNDIRLGLREIPSISVVMPFSDFWAVNDTDAERQTSAEILYPDGSSEQVDCGLVGHSHKRLKRSFRLAFRREYGEGMFNTRLFRQAPENGDTATEKYNRIMLRGGNNRAWSRGWNPDTTCFTRDQWYRDSQVAMSGVGSRGTFAHLYVNGIYWGLYNPCERTDGSYSASYMGGDKADWYAVNHGGSQGGDPSRWNYVKNILPGMEMDGENYAVASVYLDMPLYCDYIIVSWMSGVQDWPQNNWWGGNRNNPARPFMYFGWDCEWALGLTSKNSSEGAWVHPDFENNDSGGATIAALWHSLRVNTDFMTLFSDRVYKHCFNGGAVSDERSRARWATLNNYIRNAVVAESAKWGDAAPGGTRTRDGLWQTEVNKVDGFFDGNAAQLLAALRSQGYYPSYDPPLFKQGGTLIEVPRISVINGFQLTLNNPDGSSLGSIYYTLDGSDPRDSGGALGDSAIDGSDLTTITFNQTTTVKARIRRSVSDWSALHELVLFVDEDRSGLKVTEIMYNPAPQTMATSRGILSIVGDAGTLNSGDYGRAQLEFESTLPDELTADDLVVISGAAVPGNNGSYTISKVIYEGTENSTRTKKVLLTEPLVDEGSSPAVAELLYDGDRFEFVELKNTGSHTLNLSGITFSRGLSLTLPDTTLLAPGGFAVLAKQPWDLTQRYSGLSVLSGFSGGSLDNAGEELELSFSTGERVSISSVTPEAGGRTRLQFSSLSATLSLPAGVRLLGSINPANNGFYEIQSISNNTVQIEAELTAEGAGAWAVFHESLTRIDYNDRPPWPMAADGYGYSMVPTNANSSVDPNQASSWRASSAINGSPGADDPAMNTVPAILVNEVLTHTDAPQRDTIELYNPTALPVDLGGWFLTDDNDVPQNYVIPAGVIIPAFGYIAIYEGHYVGSNLLFDDNEFGSEFSLSSLGEEVYLFSPTLDYVHGFDFDAAANGVSFGRHLTSEGKEHFPAQISFTPAAVNSGPAVGPVVISEIMYHPDNNDANPDNHDHEFIELVNISDSAVNLYDPLNPSNTWEIKGVGFSFPAENVVMAAGEVLLLVKDTITPVDFRAKYGLPASVQVFNYDGTLSNSGEAVSIRRPDEPVASGSNAGEVGYIVVDKVSYRDEAPWLESADGSGPSLERIDISAYGNDPVNYQASALPGGTPGFVDTPGGPILAMNSSGINLEVLEGQTPSDQLFSVWNAGEDILYYDVAIDAEWLSIAPPTGSSTGAVDQVLHTLSFRGLAPGSHEADVSITSSNALNSQLSFSVVVTVTANIAPTITDVQVGANPVVVNQPVVFNSTVLDDMFPGRPLTLSWAITQKPFGASASFSPSTAVSDPELTFDTAGNYTVSLTASDTQYAAVTSVVVNVLANIPQSVEGRVLFSEDDMEEHVPGGIMEDLESSDLEMVQESANDDQIVGLRFRNQGIPPGAVITQAELRFTVDETDSGETHLEVWGELNTNAVAFTTSANDISSRQRTVASVAWNDIPAWTSIGDSGAAQTTPDLKTIVQELIDQPGWTEGSPVVLILGGSGKRVAESFDGGGVNNAPLLHVDYLLGAVSPDQDGDGMDDAWEIAYFGSTNAPNGGALEDYDGDNFINMHEQYAGTNPTNALSLLVMTGIQSSGPDEVVLTWQSVDGKSYALFSSTNLSHSGWNVVTNNISGIAPFNVRTVEVHNASTFFRVELE